MTMVRLFPAMLLLVALPATAQIPNPRRAIETAMTASAAGWNAGDVDRFLAVYSDDPATSFTGSSGVARGKARIRARYLKTYAGQFGSHAVRRSTLSFDLRDFRLLGPEHALLIARWKLFTPGKARPNEGMTSLVFRRERSGWHIIADHSS